jgi:hypothetical protein
MVELLSFLLFAVTLVISLVTHSGLFIVICFLSFAIFGVSVLVRG